MACRNDTGATNSRSFGTTPSARSRMARRAVRIDSLIGLYGRVMIPRAMNHRMPVDAYPSTEASARPGWWKVYRWSTTEVTPALRRDAVISAAPTRYSSGPADRPSSQNRRSIASSFSPSPRRIPGVRSRRWSCRSIIPGSTSIEEASTVRRARCFGPPTATIRPRST